MFGIKELIVKFKNFFKKFSIIAPVSRSILEKIDFYSTPNPSLMGKFVSDNKKSRLFIGISILSTFIIIYLMLFYCFPPTVLFNSNTTNGGDMGAHNYIAKFFIDELFPNLRMTGWDMGWFAGMPMLTFYFPLPYLLIAILSKIVTYNIAFKLITILGSLMLPVALYYFGKLFKLEYPYPQLAAVGAMAFLYMKSFTIYGGNFLGTFAGEFSYSISFALVFILIGNLYKGMEKGKFYWLFVINCILLDMVVLTHLITLIALLIIVPSLFLIRRNLKAAKYLIAVFIVGFFLSAFWSIPFVFDIKWSPPMQWTNLKNFKALVPLEIIPALVLGACGIFFYALKKDKRMTTVIWTIIVFLSILFTWDGGRFYNARLLPFIFIFIYLLAAYGLSNLYWIMVAKIKINELDRKKAKRRFLKFIVIAFIPIIAFLSSGAIMAGNPLGPAWARHNYTGFESKSDWKTYDSLMKYLDTLPYGRVMFEFNKKIIEKYGTPRSFELIPYWTNQAGMEGLLVESSLTAPFHYINQAELSVKPRGTVAGWSVPGRNYENAMIHLKYMNIRYIMASSEEVINDLNKDKSVVFLNKIDPYSFYEIKGSNSYVEIMDNIPFRYETKKWVWDMRDWYLNTGNINSPVIYDTGKDDIKKYPKISKEELSNVPKNPVENKGYIISEKVEREKIEFYTTGIGQPHVIKVSYFPNWKVYGAEGPYLVSPSFMLVIPTQSKVTLVYRDTTENTVGNTLTAAGWVILAAILILNLIILLVKRKRRSLL
jgi:hypothetical protein